MKNTAEGPSDINSGTNNVDPNAVGPSQDQPPEDILAWKSKTFYERLGVPDNATEAEINAAFRRLSRKYHPDPVHSNKELSANYLEVQTLIAEAKTTLLKPEERVRYNAQLAQAPVETRPETNTEIEPESKTEVDDFVSYASPNSQSKYSHDRIANRLAILVAQGFDREFLLAKIKPVVVENFRHYAEIKSEYSHGIPSVADFLESLVNLGFKKEELFEVIKDETFRNFLHFVETRSAYSHGIPAITDFLESLVRLGFNKEELISSVSDVLIENFEKYSKANSDYSHKFPMVDSFMADLVRFGIDQNKLAEIVRKDRTK